MLPKSLKKRGKKFQKLPKMKVNGEKQKCISFSEFELDTAHRTLLRNGETVSLYAKTFDLLKFLVENNGRILTKDEILEAVWEGQIVEEANLSVQISALRKALDEKKDSPRFLVTVPGKGYKFVADFNHNTEIVIEKQKLTRTTIEEELEISDERGLTENTKDYLISKQKIKSYKTLVFASVLICLILVGSFIAFWIYKKSSTNASVVPLTNEPMNITQITDGRKAVCPSISPDGKFIAFAENYGTGTGSLYLHQTETNTTVQLLEPGERTFGCTNFSPDGSQIYYIEFTKQNPLGILYSIPIVGGTPKRIITEIGVCFAVSPDNKKVIFPFSNTEKGINQWFIADIESGKRETFLAENLSEYEFEYWAAWSPDGKTIAIVAKPKNGEQDSLTIYGVDVQSKKIKPLTRETFAGFGKLSWTSDGLNIVFVANNELHLLDVSSGVVRRITNDLQKYGNYGMGITTDSNTLVANTYNDKSEIWSVDSGGDTKEAVRLSNGKKDGYYGISQLKDGQIAYISETGKSLEITIAGEDGTQKKLLTNDSSVQKDVVASPDGRYLVFASDQTGNYEIYRMNAEDGSEVTQLTFTKTANTKPDISPDGQWIAYNSFDGNQTTIWKMPLIGGESVRLTDYQANSPVFSPDGETIACILPSRYIKKIGNLAVIPSVGGKPLKTFPVINFSWNFETIRWKPDGTAIIYHNQKTNLLEQPISGGESNQLTNFSSGYIRNFTYSRDGKKLLISRGENFVDVVLIKNFR